MKYIVIVLLSVICLTGCGTTERLWPFEQDVNSATHKKLQMPISVKYEDVDIFTVVDDLRIKSGLNVVTTPVVMAGSPPPITLNLTEVRIGTVLMFISKLTALRLIIQDDVVVFDGY